MSFVDTKPVQRLFSLYCDGPVPSQDELGKALDTMEGMVALATPVFLPGEFHGERSLVGYSPWGCKELGTTEPLTPSLGFHCNLSLKGVKLQYWSLTVGQTLFLFFLF